MSDNVFTHIWHSVSQHMISVISDPRTSHGSAIATASFSVASIFEAMQPVLAGTGTLIGIAISISLYFYQRQKHIREEQQYKIDSEIAELELKELRLRVAQQERNFNREEPPLC